ncbi:DNA polymerase IV [bacterium BMS3Abin08]|nr:DNA polymerase IV [bacterium BMS3Abin08]
MVNTERTILLVDMDAFFASVEQRCNPALRGKPIGVIGGGHRTVITTASYEARAYGVKTGMNIYEARGLCPRLILVVGDNSKYTHTCATLKNLYLRYTPVVEVYSVDEAFLDITGSHHLFGGPGEVGRQIKEGVRDLFGINATVGIGPNKLIAKLASDLSKPDGLRWVREDEVEGLLEDLPVDKLWGVGKGFAKRLESIGVRTCGELGRSPVGVLRSHFGIPGERLKAMGLGADSAPLHSDEVEAGDETRSIGHSMTLSHDIYSHSEIQTHILRLSEMVGARARRYGFSGRVIGVTVRYRSFETFTRHGRTNSVTNDTRRIYKSAMGILEKIRLKEPVRLLGVTLSGLEKMNGQIPLFEEHRQRERLLKAVDSLNERFGSFTLTWAPCLYNPLHGGVISPAWRPSGVRKSL